MVLQPSLQVKARATHVAQLERIATEIVWQQARIAMRGELVSKKLAVDVNAKDVWQDQDSLLGGLAVLGIDDVSVNWVNYLAYSYCPEEDEVEEERSRLTTSNLLDFANRVALMLEPSRAACAGRMGSHCVL